jgi:hypothetical protein
MAPEMEHLLHCCNKKQLVLLVQTLALHHPDLQREMTMILKQLAESTDKTLTPLPPIDLETYKQRIAGYRTRSKQKKSLQWINNDLVNMLKEAQKRADYEDYRNALAIYALVIDERLAEYTSTLTPIFDKALEEIIPDLQSVLTEASSNIILHPSAIFTPLLMPELRHRWLERLFALWLKRLPVSYEGEDIPEIMLELAWANDIPSLQNYIQKELQRLQQEKETNSVDFTQQSRIHAIERFLRKING